VYVVAHVKPLAGVALISHMANDKKAEAGRLTFILTLGIGQAFVEKGVDPAVLRTFLVKEGAAA
jgi:3-dehydroquinate synthase